MSTLAGGDLIQRLSCYNNNYYCIIEKVQFFPGLIRVYIDVRGDNSLGSLQDPMSSTLGIVDDSTLTQVKSPIDGKFPISDEDRQHLGYLDFALDASLLNSEQTIGFQFGSDGYSMAVLFRFNQALVKQYHVK